MILALIIIIIIILKSNSYDYYCCEGVITLHVERLTVDQVGGNLTPVLVET